VAALRDIKAARELGLGGESTNVGWEELRRTYQYAYLALLANDPTEYRAACQQAVSQFRNIGAAPGSVERWNALYFFAWTIALADQDGRNAADQELVVAALAQAAEGNRRPNPENAKLLTGAVLYRFGDYEKARSILHELTIHPFDELYVAMSLWRIGNQNEARAFLQKAKGNVCLMEEQMAKWDRQTTREFFAPDWPGDLDAARRLQDECDRMLGPQ
jgi:hypothetical protein